MPVTAAWEYGSAGNKKSTTGEAFLQNNFGTYYV
jgi:hypothetical protein